MIKTVIFDLGGTLIEYAGEHDAWPQLEEPGLNEAYAILTEAGLELPGRQKFQEVAFETLPGRWADATAGKQNLTTAGFLAEVLDLLQAQQPDRRTLDLAVTRYEAAVCAGAIMVPHAQAVVEQLSQDGYRLGLISNTMYSGQSHLADMERFGLSGYFESMLFSADANKWKPTRAPFNHVMSELRANPESTVFIGDDPGADVIGARRAGMHVVHFHSSDRFPSQGNELPDATIDDLRQLESVLRYMNGALPGVLH
ncbi:MAG: HAD family hydrolase [Chloroflexota bacterium]|jgi:putative hydrolase of the HAD superfamily